MMEWYREGVITTRLCYSLMSDVKSDVKRWASIPDRISRRFTELGSTSDGKQEHESNYNTAYKYAFTSKLAPSPFARSIMILMTLTKALTKAYIKSPKSGDFLCMQVDNFSRDFNLHCVILT